MIKTFNQYSVQFSKDPSNFLNRVNIATSEGFNYDYFNIISNSFDLKESDDSVPVILTDNFSADYEVINESTIYKYNNGPSPSKSTVLESFSNTEYSPNYVNSIRDVKKLKFPIVASNSKSSDEYKTIGKLKNCNSVYNRFTEKPVPKTLFKILSFKGKPISIVEWINRFPIDVDMNSFKYLDESIDLSNSVHEKFKLDLCNISILESDKGKIYISSVDKIFDFNPHQAKLVYEEIYEDFYRSRLPNFIKNKVMTESVIPYYKNKYYDSKLIKSNHSMDYSRYIK